MKIGDFGSAKMIEFGTSNIKTQNISCTRLYASPQMLDYYDGIHELKLDSKENWAKMDLYSIGIVILVMLDVPKKTIIQMKKNPE